MEIDERLFEVIDLLKKRNPELSTYEAYDLGIKIIANKLCVKKMTQKEINRNLDILRGF